MVQNHQSCLITLIVLIFLLCLFPTNAQINTHQTIIKPKFNYFVFNIKENDLIKVTIYDTVAPVYIGLSLLTKGVNLKKTGYALIDENVTLQYLSQHNSKASIILNAKSFQYSYEITINGKVWKSENFLNDFINDIFTYNKNLPNKKYDIKVSYQSKRCPKIYFNFMNKSYTVQANQQNSIQIQATEDMPYYQILFEIDSISQNSFQDFLFEIKMELPNQMLHGCDGTNLYDTRIRACPFKTEATTDSIQIHKIGDFPTFQIHQSSKVNLKMTILQIKRWPEFFYDPALVVYLAKNVDMDILQAYTGSDLESNIEIKQRHVVKPKQNVCNFVFKLEPGNYTMITFISSTPQSVLNLFQRSVEGKLVESYYFMSPILDPENDLLFNSGGILEFVSNEQKLTEVIMESESQFLLMKYNVFRRKPISEQDHRSGQVEYVQIKTDTAFNRDPYKASVLLETYPKEMYLFLYYAADLQKFKEYQREKAESVTDQEVDLSQLSLKSDILQISVKNGRFPHKKLQEPTLAQILHKKKLAAQYQNTSISLETLTDNAYIFIGVIAGVILIGILVFVGCFIKTKLSSKKVQGKQLVEENPTTSVNVESVSGQSAQTNIEISQIVSTETLN